LPAVRVLFLSQRVPYPPDRGDRITTWRLVERLRRRAEVIAVGFAHDERDLRAAAELSDLGVRTIAVRHHRWLRELASLPLLLTRRPLTLGVYGSSTLQRHVDSLIGGCDLAYAYSSSMAAFLLPHTGLPRVMHFAELDSDKWRQYAQRSRPPMSWIYEREGRTLLEFERRVAHSFDENVLCTTLEQEVFRREVPGASSMVLPNGVDLEAFRPRPELSEPAHLVFTGVMDYLPNVDACVHFARAVLPRVRSSRPDARFTIVGANPTARVRALGRLPAVTVTGSVPATGEWLARAQVAVAPLRIARGIQNKVLEAMATGLPVVATSRAVQGIGGADGREYRVADGPEEQARAVVELLDDPPGGRAMGLRARRFVEERYAWERVFAPLDVLIDRLLSAGPRRATAT
jgi:sugar transferase (PEP-CTERM/EpsH1 system associated)